MNNNEPLVKLPFKDIEKEFADTDELQEFAELQRNSWSWLEKLASEYGSSLDETWSIYSNYLNQIDAFLSEYKQLEEEKTEESEEELEEQSKEGEEKPDYKQDQKEILIKELLSQTEEAVDQGFFQSESPEAKFVLYLRDKKTPEVAGCALAFLMNQNVDLHERFAIEGCFWSLQFLQGNTDTVKAQQSALESMKQDWNTKFGEQHQTLTEQNEKITAEITSLKSQHESLVQSMKNQIEEAEEQLKDIAHTYDEKLALQSSVKYWSNKRTHHQKVMWWIGAATLVCAIATASGFIWWVREYLKETVTQIPLSHLGVTLAISSFGIWLTRLLSKIFISNLHLRTDADERTTMIQTYLALTREGKGPKDEERQLILQTLFRQSSTGFIKEDGPASFLETLSKMLGK